MPTGAIEGAKRPWLSTTATSVSQQTTRILYNKTYEIMGFRVAMEVGDLLQGMNAMRPESGEFGKIARENGLKAALNWRDEKFGDYGTVPAAKMARDIRKAQEAKQGSIPPRRASKSVGEEDK